MNHVSVLSPDTLLVSFLDPLSKEGFLNQSVVKKILTSQILWAGKVLASFSLQFACFSSSEIAEFRRLSLATGCSGGFYGIPIEHDGA